MTYVLALDEAQEFVQLQEGPARALGRAHATITVAVTVLKPVPNGVTTTSCYMYVLAVSHMCRSPPPHTSPVGTQLYRFFYRHALNNIPMLSVLYAISESSVTVHWSNVTIQCIN